MFPRLSGPRDADEQFEACTEALAALEQHGVKFLLVATSPGYEGKVRSNMTAADRVALLRAMADRLEKQGGTYAGN